MGDVDATRIIKVITDWENEYWIHLPSWMSKNEGPSQLAPLCLCVLGVVISLFSKDLSEKKIIVMLKEKADISHTDGYFSFVFKGGTSQSDANTGQGD